MFNYFYLFLCALVYGISLPFLIITSFRTKHRRSIPARFFLDQRFCADFKPALWFHACSFGEIKSIEPIITSLLSHTQSNQTPYQILITTITQTGYNLAQKTYHNHSNIRIHYLPFEIFLPLYKHRLKSLQTLIVTEAELWFELFYLAKSLKAKTLLINARISNASYPKYKKLAFLYRKIFSYIDKILAQTQNDMNHFLTLGANEVCVFGNLKLLATPTITHTYPKPDKLCIIGASTHHTEEEMILESFLALKATHHNAILFLAPRHPERFILVEELLQKNLLRYAKLSDGFRDDVDVLLIDKLMELNNFYAIGDVVILGGAFIKAGGHNPIEPAYFHNKIISGTHIFNQHALFECIQGYTLTQNLTQTLLSFETIPKSQILSIDSKLPELCKEITKGIHNAKSI
ncbi:lipid IV(A) 3-deoxy-D-manno-octulosonic acid transferase [Helicobacter fennelliae]|uniref:3-deoxy-D-manno-octulosonic acid transferase n=2 Tax=Helicobacter fennelliae TaxID=215 RepID=T1D229_9HELI|nr:lipid IV(A) 3-deoxy-D-manno-octulosonic acid transferase [Helicobacter fennelliae]GAD19286.1 3-deoxy-D-manno-octulosonic-acid transferase [Helicobacter fennelliae MRY12-0050]